MQISVIQAILLGLFAFLVNTSMFPLGWLSQNIMGKPLVVCGIIGIIMGRVQDALLIGCVIQAAYIGQMAIGGVSTLPTIAVSLWFSLPIALTSGGDAATCLATCLAFAAVESAVSSVGNLFKIGFLHRQDAMIEKGQIKNAWWFPVLGHIWTFLYCMLIVPTFCLAGSSVVGNLLAALPSQVLGITSTFTGLLPSIGFMLLMVTMIHNPFQWTYFLLGFVLVAGLGWDTISVTLLGCVIAYLIFQFTPDKQSAIAVEEDDD